MKVSPIGASTGAQHLEAPTTHAGVSVSRKEAAKAAFNGTKLTESNTPTDEAVKRARNNLQRIKMETNKSTNRMEAPVEATEAPAEEPTEQSGGISDVGSEAAAEETKPLSPQFAALAKAKRALQVKERELRDLEASLKNQSAPQASGFSAEQIKQSPLAILEQAGVSYDDLTQAILQNPQGHSPELLALKAELKSLKEEFSNTLKERDAAIERDVLAEMRRETDRLVREGDAFEMIRETGSESDVVNLIHRIYKSEGTILGVEEAAMMVEEELLKEAEKIARIKKLQSRLTPAEAAEVEAEQQRAPQQMRTLTNRNSAGMSYSRRERAIRAFNNSK